MIDLKTPREAATKAAQTIADGTSDYASRAKDFSTTTTKNVKENAGPYFEKVRDLGESAADSATETVKTVLERAQDFTGRSIERVGEVPVGQKNVSERAQATVDTMQEKVDVEHLQDQVAKLREQMEQALVSWKDSFLAGTSTEKSATAKKAPVKKAAPKPKAATAKKAPVKKAAPKPKAATATKATTTK